MKLIRILCLGLIGTFVLTACENENFVQDLAPEGAMVYISPESDDTGLVNFLNPDNTRMHFTVSMTDEQGRDLEFAPVASMDITVTYTDASTGTTDKQLLQNITTWPQTFDLTLDDLVSLFPDNVVTQQSLELGDGFFITADFRMEDGRFLSGWSPALLDNSPASIYRVFVNYPVACPSDLAGTYLAECVSCDNGEVPSQTVTITELSAGAYTLSDISMDIFGGGFAIAYDFTDICNQLSVAAASRDYGSQISLEVQDGTQFDPATGVITFNLKYVSPSCCGLDGLQVSYTLTPQD